MSLTGKILFPNDVSNICCGDNINLIIEIENHKEVFVKEILLSLRGEIDVKWEDILKRNKDGRITYTMQTYEGQQILLDKHINFQTMDVYSNGIHQYKLILTIPHDLPQSVKRKYGSIKYELKLSVCYTAQVELLCTVPLEIKACRSIYDDKKYMRPFYTVFKKYLCWGICSLEPLKVIITVPNTSFDPGESIKYFLKIENRRKFLNLQRLSVILTQIHHYKALKPKERIKQVRISLKQIVHLFTDNYNDSKLEGSLQLPESLVPTSSHPCLLNTSYSLNFVLVFVGFLTDGFISLPINIGNHKEDTENIINFTKCDMKRQIEQDKKAEYEV